MSAPVQQQPVYDVHQGNQQMAVAPGAPTNHATTTTAAGAGAAHPGQHDDVQDWMTRLQGALNNPETVTAPTSAGAQPWHTEFFSCFSPIDICAITCFAPCVTFGKTHHRTRKSPTMEGYNPVNPTCLGFWVAACFGVHCIPMMIQRSDIRRQHNLEGDFAMDLLKTWCCGCCTLIQEDKETAYRALNSHSAQPQYQATEQMKYGA